MQSLGSLSSSDLLNASTSTRFKIELYYGGSWQTPEAIIGDTGGTLTKSVSTSMGGARPTIYALAGSWSAEIYNPGNVFHFLHPASAYTDVFQKGRKVRISEGLNVGGTDYFYSVMCGIISEVKHDILQHLVHISGYDYSQLLTDYKFKEPTNYWGDSILISTEDPDETLDAEIYAEGDALEIGAGEANNVTNWAKDGASALSSVADVGGGSLYALSIQLGTGSVVKTYAVAGSYYWTCPAGVTSVDVECWGGGGGGGSSTSFYGAGGGGGGAYAKKTVTVTPGETYTIRVGAKGAKGTGGMKGGNGQSSYFRADTTDHVLAAGGKGGDGSTLTRGMGGLGGLAADSIGDTRYKGGDGGAANGSAKGAGGGGGSSAGPSSAGKDGATGGVDIGGAGGAAVSGGGPGAKGGNDDSSGSTPSSPPGGGGGGAGWWKDAPSAPAGGDGKAGKIVITYTGPPDSDSIYNDNVGAVTADTGYKISFKVKRVSGPGQLICRTFIGSTQQENESDAMAPADYTEEHFYFTATASGNLKVQFDITGADNTTEFRVDQVSLIKIISIYYKRSYALPEGATGINFAQLDGVPIFEGEDPNGWTYDPDNNAIVLSEESMIEAGTDNLLVGYYSPQTIEDVLCSLMVRSGLYIDDVAAMADLQYTSPGITIDRVWFDAGTNGMEAARKLAERCDYNFFFQYDGKPVFVPRFVLADPGGEDLILTFSSVAQPEPEINDEEMYNSITITGEEQAHPLQMDSAAKCNLTGHAQDAASIETYGARDLEINNHLWQTQDDIDASRTAYLERLKNPRGYLPILLPYCPLPVEMGDTVKAALFVADPPKKITLTDSAGKTIVGYLGESCEGETTSEVLTDGGLENWTSPTNLTNWGEYISGLSTVNQETGDLRPGTSGANAARIDVDGSNTSVYFNQVKGTAPGGLYRLDFWYKNSAAGKTAVFYFYKQGGGSALKSDGTWNATTAPIYLPSITAWEQYAIVFNGHPTDINFVLQFMRSSAASSSIYFDDVSLVRITDGPTTGLRVYSDISLSTRGWASMDADFDPAKIVSWKIVNGWDGTKVAEGTEKAYLDATTANAFVYLATSDLSAYAGTAPVYPRGVVRDIKTTGRSKTLILDLGSI